MRRVLQALGALVRFSVRLAIGAALLALAVALVMAFGGHSIRVALSFDGRPAAPGALAHAVLGVVEVLGYAALALASTRDAWRRLAAARLGQRVPAGDALEAGGSIRFRLWLLAALLAWIALRAVTAPWLVSGAP